MKREDVKKILPEITNEQLDSIMKLHGDSVTEYKVKVASLENEIEVKNGVIEGKNTKISELEGIDIEKIKKDEFERGRAESAKEIEDFKFSQAIDSELTKAGAKNTKALKALLDTENIKFENGALEGLSEQLEQIKAENGFLFDDSTPKPKFTDGSSGKCAEITKDVFDKMGYSDRIKLFKENPEVYNELNN